MFRNGSLVGYLFLITAVMGFQEAKSVDMWMLWTVASRVREAVDGGNGRGHG